MVALEAQQDRAMAWSVLNRNDERWRRLRKLICEHSLRVGDFKLSSGRRSPYFFQLRQTTMFPEGAALLGEVILEYMYQHSIECVGGLELGAVPLVSSVAVMSHIRALPIKVLMVDDVATTGGSILKAVEGIEGHGCYVRRALAIVDREEGAADNLAGHGIQLAAIFKRSDFPEI
jgi:orotate phosphoribosyltransferase